ncbi:uncharacterized protein METZ01_LOCUS204355, partial [marine metagenome]
VKTGCRNFDANNFRKIYRRVVQRKRVCSSIPILNLLNRLSAIILNGELHSFGRRGDDLD